MQQGEHFAYQQEMDHYRQRGFCADSRAAALAGNLPTDSPQPVKLALPDD